MATTGMTTGSNSLMKNLYQGFGSDTNTNLNTLYQNYFGRDGDTEGMNYWSQELNSGNIDYKGIEQLFSENDAAKRYNLNNLYQNYFGRDGDQEGMNYWLGEINNGYSWGDLENSFAATPESQAYINQSQGLLSGPNLSPTGYDMTPYQENGLDGTLDINTGVGGAVPANTTAESGIQNLDPNISTAGTGASINQPQATTADPYADIRGNGYQGQTNYNANGTLFTEGADGSRQWIGGTPYFGASQIAEYLNLDPEYVKQRIGFDSMPYQYHNLNWNAILNSDDPLATIDAVKNDTFSISGLSDYSVQGSGDEIIVGNIGVLMPRQGQDYIRGYVIYNDNGAPLRTVNATNPDATQLMDALNRYGLVGNENIINQMNTLSQELDKRGIRYAQGNMFDGSDAGININDFGSYFNDTQGGTPLSQDDMYYYTNAGAGRDINGLTYSQFANGYTGSGDAEQAYSALRYAANNYNGQMTDSVWNAMVQSAAKGADGTRIAQDVLWQRYLDGEISDIGLASEIRRKEWETAFPYNFEITPNPNDPEWANVTGEYYSPDSPSKTNPADVFNVGADGSYSFTGTGAGYNAGNSGASGNTGSTGNTGETNTGSTGSVDFTAPAWSEPASTTDWSQSSWVEPNAASGTSGNATASGNTTSGDSYQQLLGLLQQAQQGTIDPNTMTVQGQLAQILDSNSPLMQRARYQGQAYANGRGLLNSSIAAGAAQNAMIDAATPIATADAATYFGNMTNNVNARNQFGLQANDALSNLFMQNDSQAFASGENALQRQFQSSEAATDRAFTASENALGRQFQSGESALDRAFNANESELSRQFQSGESALDRAFNANENLLQRDFTSGENALDRAQNAEQFYATQNFERQMTGMTTMANMYANVANYTQQISLAAANDINAIEMDPTLNADTKNSMIANVQAQRDADLLWMNSMSQAIVDAIGELGFLDGFEGFAGFMSNTGDA